MTGMIGRLGAGFVDKGEHVFERDITFDGVGRGEDIATGAAEIEEPARFGADIVSTAVRERSLGGKTAVEGETAAVMREQGADIHDFRLEGIKAIEPDGN